MSTKAEQRRQAKVMERIRREREAKKAANEARQARKEAMKAVGPAVPMWRRAGQWLNQLQTVSPAIANDEILLTVAKVSLLLRGMYKTKPTAGVGVALQVLDSLGTGLSGAEIPEAWDLVSKDTMRDDTQQGADDHRPDAPQGDSGGEAPLGGTEPLVQTVDPLLVPAHGGDGTGESVQPVFDPAESL